MKRRKERPRISALRAKIMHRLMDLKKPQKTTSKDHLTEYVQLAFQLVGLSVGAPLFIISAAQDAYKNEYKKLQDDTRSPEVKNEDYEKIQEAFAVIRSYISKLS